MKKKRFFPRSVMLYMTEQMKNELMGLPNMSEFVREAIQEKLSTIKGKVVDNNENARGNIEENS